MSRLTVLVAFGSALSIAGIAGLVAALGSAESAQASRLAGLVWFASGAVAIIACLVLVMRMRIRDRQVLRDSQPEFDALGATNS